MDMNEWWKELNELYDKLGIPKEIPPQIPEPQLEAMGEPTPMSKLHFDPNDFPVFKEFRDRYIEEAEQYEQRARDLRRDREQFSLQLQERAKYFMHLGVGLIDGAMTSDFSYRNMKITPRRFFEQIARGLERPCITLEYTSGYALNRPYTHYHELRVPRTKRLENVVSGLLLLTDNPPVGEDLAPIGCEHNPRSWVFYFFVPEANKILSDWLDRCCEDKLFRFCLGTQHLPPPEKKWHFK